MLLLQKAWVQSLVRELRSHKLRRAAKIIVIIIIMIIIIPATSWNCGFPGWC